MPSRGHTKRVQSWKRRYGITDADYQRMLVAQGGVCRVCGGPPDTVDGLLHIDHDHITGAVRGLLCKACNTALGHIKDNPETAAKLEQYLVQNQPAPETQVLPATALASVPKERPAEQRGRAYLTDKELKDARLPRPELVKAMEQAGLDRRQIAEELGISQRTTKALLTQAEKSAMIETARDVLIRDVVAAAVAKVKLGVEIDDNGQFSLDFLNKLGVFPKDPVQAPSTGAGGFEEWRAEITKRVYVDSPRDPRDSTEIQTIDAEPVVRGSVPGAAAPPEERAARSGQEGDEARAPDTESPRPESRIGGIDASEGPS